MRRSRATIARDRSPNDRDPNLRGAWLQRRYTHRGSPIALTRPRTCALCASRTRRSDGSWRSATTCPPGGNRCATPHVVCRGPDALSRGTYAQAQSLTRRARMLMAAARVDAGATRTRGAQPTRTGLIPAHRPHLLRQLSQRIAACACVARRDGGGVAARVRVRAVVGQRPPLGPGAGDDAAVLCIWRALFGTERPRRQPMAFNGSLRVLWVLWGTLGHLWYSRVL